MLTYIAILVLCGVLLVMCHKIRKLRIRLDSTNEYISDLKSRHIFRYHEVDKKLDEIQANMSNFVSNQAMTNRTNLASITVHRHKLDELQSRLKRIGVSDNLCTSEDYKPTATEVEALRTKMRPTKKPINFIGTYEHSQIKIGK